MCSCLLDQVKQVGRNICKNSTRPPHALGLCKSKRGWRPGHKRQACGGQQFLRDSGGWPAHFVRVVWVLQAQPRSLRENESTVLFWQVVAATRGSIFTKKGPVSGTLGQASPLGSPEFPHPPVCTRAAAVVTCNDIKPAVAGPCLVTSRAAMQDA